LFTHCAYINVSSEGVQSIWSPDISDLGHFGPWARLVCRMLAGGCSCINTISRIRVGFGIKVRVRDRCAKVLKCPRNNVNVHQFGPIYHTEIMAEVQCMYADQVIWGGKSGG